MLIQWLPPGWKFGSIPVSPVRLNLIAFIEQFLWRRSKLGMCLFHPYWLYPRSEIIFFIPFINYACLLSWYYPEFITIFVSLKLEFKCFEFASVRDCCTIYSIFWLLWFIFRFFQDSETRLSHNHTKIGLKPLLNGYMATNLT